eukprot:scaffold257974_cov42-Prasinocladus_malaysianus.AAC.1
MIELSIAVPSRENNLNKYDQYDDHVLCQRLAADIAAGRAVSFTVARTTVSSLSRQLLRATPVRYVIINKMAKELCRGVTAEGRSKSYHRCVKC